MREGRGATDPRVGRGPRWAFEPFHDFLDFTERLNHLVHLTIQGIASLRARPNAMEVLRGTSASESGTEYEAKIDRARKEAELAQSEVDSDFPLVHAQAAVAMWGALENLIRTVVARWIRHNPQLLSRPPLQGLRIKIGEYETLDEEEKAEFLADQLDRSVGAPLRHGVTRFETLLDAIGLAGAVEESVRKDIFEIGHVRNVIVHRGGRADRRLVEACPWMGLGVGEPCLVSHTDFARYSHATSAYCTGIIHRVRDHFGLEDMRDVTAQPRPATATRRDD